MKSEGEIPNFIEGLNQKNKKSIKRDYFENLKQLIEGKKQNIKLFERIEKKRVLGVSPAKTPSFSYL
ncbi:hypothetical protein AKJ37_01150 [candidate division MSBL1 archaeon SCGC-AAA259I09]|uniref:Uncharacterized protein n=1 Tax=candidate division MSBL1 archaeon SCGC-AAA259I09 TaxID=1698267 RepID=A0A133UVE3_9EURY|nr:hypothetical protein AKJ37_01150 [candidate division MSBL1 archaeon SCGC-AAA259I09]